MLSSPKWSTDKVKGGKPTKVDDVYAQLIVLKESIEHDTNDIINRKLELSRLINKVSNPKRTRYSSHDVHFKTVSRRRDGTFKN